MSAGTIVRKAEDGLRRIEALDGRLNAFLTVDHDGARRIARQLDDEGARGRLLFGLTTAIKDLTDTAGLRTTYGSLHFRDHVPAEDDLIVARLRRAGALILGKTMTPEFGFGAICTNRIKGPTRNPWNPELTSGGSSGGAAVAVAAGMVDVAHGTDFGGSVRTPASFCGIASIRPTPGMLPNPARARAYDMLSTAGFLARDTAMLRKVLGATSGPDRRDPLSFGAAIDASRPMPGPPRIAVTPDFGFAPVSRNVRDRFAEAIADLEQAMGAVHRDHPDCSDAMAIFHTLRPAHIRRDYGHLPREALTETVRWWIDRGANITADDYLAAEAARTAYARRFHQFFDRFDILVAPAAPILPWPNAEPNVLEIDGRPLDTIAEYLAVTYAVTLAGCPVVTLPARLRDHALPFGVQVIGAPWTDMRLLDAAERIAELAGFRAVPPPELPDR